MKESILQNKSYDFALTVIEVCRQLTNEPKEFVLSKQLLGSATTIRVNIIEANGAQSKKDFLHSVELRQHQIEKKIQGYH